MNKRQLLRVLQDMTTDELNAVIAEARGGSTDVKALIERELAQPKPPALNSDQIIHMALGHNQGEQA